ncbi:hypothetical protein H310_12381 [Aphanomyces invadans]|uniref:Uncharacterized protein n=1 Tax=Aphanomyces invadans TaxID=157072 RepID=A0A024TID5_9STRA|nr:hypothetical protein H310_12381 [Aphanomyces invadans]ETV93818.1 hypothetical protein H310_12381 [Aphanomyces invadans]|eukprot:XP_008877627.1 hypothetical protein H310_12381 [Aphanomyces invadans]
MGFKMVGDQSKVLLGVILGAGICYIPLFWKTRRGHDLFSQEKPEAVYEAEVKKVLDPYKKN